MPRRADTTKGQHVSESEDSTDEESWHGTAVEEESDIEDPPAIRYSPWARIVKEAVGGTGTSSKRVRSDAIRLTRQVVEEKAAELFHVAGLLAHHRHSTLANVTDLRLAVSFLGLPRPSETAKIPEISEEEKRKLISELEKARSYRQELNSGIVRIIFNDGQIFETTKKTLESSAVLAVLSTAGSSHGASNGVEAWEAPRSRCPESFSAILSYLRSGYTPSTDLPRATLIAEAEAWGVTGLVKLITPAIRRPLRFRPGTVALREIRRYQKSTELLLRRAPLERVVREVVQDYSSTIRMSGEAMRMVREASEDYLTQLFTISNALAIHAGRSVVRVSDMQLAKQFNTADVCRGGVIHLWDRWDQEAGALNYCILMGEKAELLGHPPVPPTQQVTLNVGGRLFTQFTVAQLTKKWGFFRRLFSGVLSPREASSEIFIDRNPDNFEKIVVHSDTSLFSERTYEPIACAESDSDENCRAEDGSMDAEE
eukprot:TRINITY_DN27299_c0_g1_i1.p1 TRINITY_DN27299_c0_g1~~TRINITY_DN27299_c0_g1_i1.p1  ORF type:complete len:484 (+),score=61.33 TRINITY_DN27299_c0_g1_i1:34-1485(+)